MGSVWVKYDPALGHQGKIGLYRSLVNHVDAELCEAKELGWYDEYLSLRDPRGAPRELAPTFKRSRKKTGD
ncbi:hypothetical protein [Corynebacterium argentoratense]|uniref:hypothetical protein n=1 Tax=Corynebacterium argentoratense TaxID=42817 RepID=UPI000619F94B|nr:hypothetical protein [Corynebacterium argentoratense]